MNVTEIARLYNTSDCTIHGEIDSSHGESDKRYTYLLSFSDGEKIALKICRNLFTTAERVDGWQKLCKHYVDLGIYCPQIINSLNNNSSETILVNSEEFIIYAEEMKKYKTMEEIDPKPNYNSIRPDIIKAMGKIASDTACLLSWPSAYCLFDTFDIGEKTDENYENAESFCNNIREKFPEYTPYADKIWELYLQKRNEFEPIYRSLPKASFQSDLNKSNILVNENMEFAGLIDFNLSGTECIIYMIMLPDICGYTLKTDDLARLNEKTFLDNCDEFLYNNLKTFSDYYNFTDDERKYFCLCYNTAIPFCYWMINSMLDFAIKENKSEHIEEILDWVYYQLSRNDLTLR